MPVCSMLWLLVPRGGKQPAGDFFVSLELCNFLCRKGSIRFLGGVYYPQQVTARHQKEDSMENTEYRDLVKKLIDRCTEEKAQWIYRILLHLVE